MRAKTVANTLFEIGQTTVAPYPVYFIGIENKEIIDLPDMYNVKTMHYEEHLFEFTTEDKDKYFVIINALKEFIDVIDEITKIEVGFSIEGKPNNFVSNKGKIFKVLSTVIYILKKFLSQNPYVRNVEITSGKNGIEDKRRENIYKEYAKNQFSHPWIYRGGSIDKDPEFGEVLTMSFTNEEVKEKLVEILGRSPFDYLFVKEKEEA